MVQELVRPIYTDTFLLVVTTFATELCTLNCASEVFQDMAGIPTPLALGFQAIYCSCRYNKIYWRHIWNSHFLNTYLSLVSQQSSLNGSPLWGDTVCYTHGECPEVLRCPWDIKALKHQDAFPGEGKAVKLYGRLPEFCKTVVLVQLGLLFVQLHDTSVSENDRIRGRRE